MEAVTQERWRKIEEKREEGQKRRDTNGRQKAEGQLENSSNKKNHQRGEFKEGCMHATAKKSNNECELQRYKVK